MTVIAVNPELLSWAREHRGLTTAQAAERLGMPEAELIAYENGAKLNLTEFRKISDTYRIPRATLLRRARPNVAPMPQDFRTIEGRRAVVGFETRLAIDYARTIEHNVLELVESGFGPATPALTRVTRNSNAAEAGELERERLGVTPAIQFGWRTAEAFGNWRAIIEAAGCFVLFQKFDLNECKGFTLYDNPNTPIIVISKAEEFEPARTFTLIHEYCHLLLREPGLSDQNSANPVEAFCNEFAAGFLLPRSVLRAILPNWPNEPVEWQRDQIREWAGQLKVSQQVLALRLESIGLAPAGFYGRIVAGQRAVDRVRTPGGNYVNTQVFEMGARYLKAVFGAIDAGEIKQSEGAEMTQLAPHHFDDVKTYIDQKFENARVVMGGIPH